MTRAEIFDGIVEILKNIRSIKPALLENVTEESDLIYDLGTPSTELVNIIAKAEDYFDVEFDDDDIDEMGSTLGDTIDLVQRTLKEQAA